MFIQSNREILKFIGAKTSKATIIAKKDCNKLSSKTNLETRKTIIERATVKA